MVSRIRPRPPAPAARPGRLPVIALLLGLGVFVAVSRSVAVLPSGPVGKLSIEQHPGPSVVGAAVPVPPRQRAFERVGHWRPIAAAPLAPRAGQSAVWTGFCPTGTGEPTSPAGSAGGCGELVVWGGGEGQRAFADGAAYDPRTDTWRPIASAPHAAGAWDMPAIWTGVEMIVWGGTIAGSAEPLGLAYNPKEDQWRVLPPSGLGARVGHALVWTGQEAIVWGGRDPFDGGLSADGAAYDPEAGSWRRLAAAPLAGRVHPVAEVVSVTGALVVWGGADRHGAPLLDGARYNPHSDDWTSIAEPNVNAADLATKWRPAGAWVRGLLWIVAPLLDQDGRRAVIGYRPQADSWVVVADPPLRPRSGATAAAAGLSLLVWGGYDTIGAPLASGVVFHHGRDQWRHMPPAADQRRGQTALWTGAQLLVWGGADYRGPTNDGAAYGRWPAPN